MKKQRRSCKNSPNMFCYVCGEFCPKSQRRQITQLLKKAYRLYFNRSLGNQDCAWAPHVTCTRCNARLTQWLKGKKDHLPFGVPMVWREPKNHEDDCYFCLTSVTGFSSKNKNAIQYPNLTSATRPIPHGENLPVPIPPSTWEEESESDKVSSDDIEPSSSRDPTYIPHEEEEKPHLITQAELNDLVRDLYLPKHLAELLGSRLQEWKLLHKDTRISVFRNRNTDLLPYFTVTDSGVCACNDVNTLMSKLNIAYNTEDWRLFIDASKMSLKAVLLHNGNKLPSIPVAYCVAMKETYENMHHILQAIKYENHNWHICGDLKVIGLLLGLQSGFTKYPCFLCLWDSRDTQQHYIVKEWPKREEFTPGQYNVKFKPLVNPQNIFLPPLHIKLGLMKNFVKAMDKTGEGFKYLQRIFPGLSDAKLKEGIFIGPQIRKVMGDQSFLELLTPNELAAWESFKSVVNGFLGNKKEENCEELVQNLLQNYKNLGCRMSLKIHFLHSHFDFFPQNLGAVSDEQGERFHQDILQMEQRYKGKWDASMMSDYCWFLQREDTTTHKRQSISQRIQSSTNSSTK